MIAGVAEQLLALRGLTQTTGIIHEAQVFQLRRWAPLAMPHLRDIHFEVDVASKTIEYRGKCGEKVRPPRQLKSLLEGLARSVKWLLGDDWELRVKASGKAIFTSKAKPPPNVKRPRKQKRSPSRNRT